MKLHRLAALFALAVAVLPAAGAPSAARATACNHTDAVFYTSDTSRLAGELGKYPSSCADYYLSITPTATGDPRGGAPITTIRSLGPQFHAMAEIRLNVWSGRVVNGDWYAAGVQVRTEMAAAGYDASLGDTWAINEVGEPSGTPMGVDVIKGNDDARRHFEDFVHGLYDGPDGVPDPGLVFAADPLQVTTDLTQYTQDLTSWYSDSTFWQAMSRDVRFWAQETYADARAWGVPASTLAQRTAYLDDYFLHGDRLAAGGDGATDAARAFFANAYTSLGNASFRQPIPDTVSGIGFGYTDIGLPGMQSFVSTQTYAERSSIATRLGFAVVPKSATAAETTAVEDQVAQSIQGSESDPLGACGPSLQWCDTDVSGAQFNDAWKAFANTLEGSGVQVQIGPDVTVTYAEVDARGATQVTNPSTGFPPPPQGLQLLSGGLYDDIETTASYTGPVGVCLAYDPAPYAGYVPHLFFLAGDEWSDVTTSVGASAVCGSAASVGVFAVFAADPTPPVIVPHVAGPLGNGGWYTGDVTVTWDVSDPQSPVSSTAGCDPVTISADTAGATLTCTATSDGGTASADVTVKRDATPPVVRCRAVPSSLWPPNHMLVPVFVFVRVKDATSGSAGFVLSAATTSDGNAARDIVGFRVGTPDVFGLLRAERSGGSSGRVYALTYTARDVAGNTSSCTATVVVEHDRRK